MPAVAVLLLGILMIYVGITGRAEAVWRALTQPTSQRR
jgi:hypothetical protein